MSGDKASQSSFNECDHCEDGYYHSYTAANGVDKSICM